MRSAAWGVKEVGVVSDVVNIGVAVDVVGEGGGRSSKGVEEAGCSGLSMHSGWLLTVLEAACAKCQ